MLAEHPDVLERLRNEILTKVGPTRRPTYDDFREMKYLRAVINGGTLSIGSRLSFMVFFRNLATVPGCVSPRHALFDALRLIGNQVHLILGLLVFFVAPGSSDLPMFVCEGQRPAQLYFHH